MDIHLRSSRRHARDRVVLGRRRQGPIQRERRQTETKMSKT